MIDCRWIRGSGLHLHLRLLDTASLRLECLYSPLPPWLYPRVWFSVRWGRTGWSEHRVWRHYCIGVTSLVFTAVSVHMHRLTVAVLGLLMQADIPAIRDRRIIRIDPLTWPRRLRRLVARCSLPRAIPTSTEMNEEVRP